MFVVLNHPFSNSLAAWSQLVKSLKVGLSTHFSSVGTWRYLVARLIKILRVYQMVRIGSHESKQEHKLTGEMMSHSAIFIKIKEVITDTNGFGQTMNSEYLSPSPYTGKSDAFRRLSNLDSPQVR